MTTTTSLTARRRISSPDRARVVDRQHEEGTYKNNRSGFSHRHPQEKNSTASSSLSRVWSILSRQAPSPPPPGRILAKRRWSWQRVWKWSCLVCCCCAACWTSSWLLFSGERQQEEEHRRAFPRSVAVYDEGKERVVRLDVYAEKYPTKRGGAVSQDALERQRQLLKSKDYYTPEQEQFVTADCKPQYEWQLSSQPSCNKLHEVPLQHHLLSTSKKNTDDYTHVINSGYFRDVWTVPDDYNQDHHHHPPNTDERDTVTPPVVLKTLRYTHAYIDRNYDRHRRDAVAMERLTGSAFIVNIYGFCANNGLFEYGRGGDIDHSLFTKRALQHPLSKYDRLRIAAQVAQGVADAHHAVDPVTRQPTIAHTDITGGQFIYIDGIFKLNDFNRARFLRWNEKQHKPCGFKVGANRGDFRSPEEYAYAEENEKVDVYSMGNIFFQLANLQYYPFPDLKEKEIQKMVMNQQRPTMKPEVLNSTDPVDVTFVKAIHMAYVHDPKERPSAREIADFLLDALTIIPYPGEVTTDHGNPHKNANGTDPQVRT